MRETTKRHSFDDILQENPNKFSIKNIEDTLCYIEDVKKKIKPIEIKFKKIVVLDDIYFKFILCYAKHCKN